VHLLVLILCWYRLKPTRWCSWRVKSCRT